MPGTAKINITRTKGIIFIQTDLTIFSILNSLFANLFSNMGINLSLKLKRPKVKLIKRFICHSDPPIGGEESQDGFKVFKQNLEISRCARDDIII